MSVTLLAPLLLSSVISTLELELELALWCLSLRNKENAFMNMH
jgi:hypothetical protein